MREAEFDGGVAEVLLAVSVIIPATRRDLLPWTLRSLLAQSYAGEYEIIIVATFADDIAQHWPVVPVLLASRCPPAQGRNRGAERAKGAILLFLDDDCAVATDWISRNVQMLSQGDIGAVGACLRAKSPAFFARSTDFACFGDFQASRPRDVLLASASMAVRRSVFTQTGGFDESMGPGEAEDIDLSHRIQQLGYRTIYQPEIVVSHDHRRDTFVKLLRHTYWQGTVQGLRTKIVYRQRTLRNRLLARLRFPPLFCILLPFIALSATVRIVAVNIRDCREVLLHMLFIFIAKLAYNYGILHSLLRNPGVSNNE